MDLLPKNFPQNSAFEVASLSFQSWICDHRLRMYSLSLTLSSILTEATLSQSQAVPPKTGHGIVLLCNWSSSSILSSSYIHSREGASQLCEYDIPKTHLQSQLPSVCGGGGGGLQNCCTNTQLLHTQHCMSERMSESSSHYCWPCPKIISPSDME